MLRARLWRHCALDFGSAVCSPLGGAELNLGRVRRSLLSRFLKKWYKFAVVNDWIEDVGRRSKSDLGLCRHVGSKRFKSRRSTVHNRKFLPFFRIWGHAMHDAALTTSIRYPEGPMVWPLRQRQRVRKVRAAWPCDGDNVFGKSPRRGPCDGDYVSRRFQSAPLAIRFPREGLASRGAVVRAHLFGTVGAFFPNQLGFDFHC